MKCPNCEILIEKNGGCPRMQCSVCSYKWCWTCGCSNMNSLHEQGNMIFGFCDILNDFTLGNYCFGFDSCSDEGCGFYTRVVLTILSMLITQPIMVFLYFSIGVSINHALKFGCITIRRIDDPNSV